MQSIKVAGTLVLFPGNNRPCCKILLVKSWTVKYIVKFVVRIVLAVCLLVSLFWVYMPHPVIVYLGKTVY
jgi:hypothetical protein